MLQGDCIQPEAAGGEEEEGHLPVSGSAWMCSLRQVQGGSFEQGLERRGWGKNRKSQGWDAEPRCRWGGGPEGV